MFLVQVQYAAMSIGEGNAIVRFYKNNNNNEKQHRNNRNEYINIETLIGNNCHIHVTKVTVHETIITTITMSLTLRLRLVSDIDNNNNSDFDSDFDLDTDIDMDKVTVQQN